jgi:hypothetical protein
MKLFITTLIQIPENYPVASTPDMIIIYALKLGLVIGFFYGMKYWVNKTTNAIPVYSSWILGIWFLFYQSFTLLHGIILNLFLFFELKMDEPRLLGVVAMFMGGYIYYNFGKIIVNRE